MAGACTRGRCWLNWNDALAPVALRKKHCARPWRVKVLVYEPAGAIAGMLCMNHGQAMEDSL